MATESNNTLSEISSEVKAAVANRLRNPFLSVFTLAWLAWNHRLLFVLFGDMSVVDRFAYIDKSMYPTWKEFVWLNIVGPALSTLLYVIFIPWLAERTLVLNLWYQRRQKVAERRSDGLELLTLQESVQLNERIANRDKQIGDLNIKLAGLQTTAARHDLQDALRESENDNAIVNALFEYLTVGRFSEKINYTSSELSAVRFDISGYVKFRIVMSSAIANVESWRLDKRELVLYSGDNVEVGRFQYVKLGIGYFVGRINEVERIFTEKD